jgi:hypothetical protein
MLVYPARPRSNGYRTLKFPSYSTVIPDVHPVVPSKLTDRPSYILVSSYQLNAHLLYSITVYMLHYNPQHVSNSTLLIFRRTNCIITASGIVTL